MGRGIIYYIFQRPRFCCCLPVRMCVIIMSFLGILLSGLLSIVCWFEVSRAYVPLITRCLPLNGEVIEGGNALTSKQRASFIGGALVEMLLLLISIVGYISHFSISYSY